jgi:hypothetical protein
MSSKKTVYAPPKVVTLDGNKIVDLLGPVSAGSGSGSEGDCIPGSWMGGC